jgi:hypothetical protein
MNLTPKFVWLIISGLFVLFPGPIFADPARGSHHFKEPFFVIYQIGADPTMTDPKYNCPFGLVAAVWDDGWVVRAKDKHLVGKQYIEGYATSKGLRAFVAEVTSTTILATPNKTTVGMDDPFRVIKIYEGSKKHEWIHLPEWKGMPFMIEARAWALPLEKTDPAPPKDWSLRPYSQDD